MQLHQDAVLDGFNHNDTAAVRDEYKYILNF